MSAKIHPRVQACFDAIKAANDELEQIRSTCLHPTYSLVWWSWGPGRFYPTRCCDHCRDALPGITPEEAKQLGPLFKGGLSFTPEPPR